MKLFQYLNEVYFFKLQLFLPFIVSLQCWLTVHKFLSSLPALENFPVSNLTSQEEQL